MHCNKSPQQSCYSTCCIFPLSSLWGATLSTCREKTYFHIKIISSSLLQAICLTCLEVNYSVILCSLSIPLNHSMPIHTNKHTHHNTYITLWHNAPAACSRSSVCQGWRITWSMSFGLEGKIGFQRKALLPKQWEGNFAHAFINLWIRELSFKCAKLKRTVGKKRYALIKLWMWA